MSSKSTFQPSGSFSLDGHWSPWGYCSPTLTGFAIIPLPAETAPSRAATSSLWLGSKTGLLSWPHDPLSLQGSALLTSRAQVFWPTDMENKISLKSAMSRGRTKRGKMLSNTCEAAHKWMRRQLLAVWQAWRVHTYHRGIGVVPTQIRNPLQSLSLQIEPQLQKCLHTTLAEIRSWGQSWGRRQNTIHRWQPEMCPRDGKASLWPNCKRMGKEEVQKCVREGKV